MSFSIAPALTVSNSKIPVLEYQDGTGNELSGYPLVCLLLFFAFFPSHAMLHITAPHSKEGALQVLWRPRGNAAAMVIGTNTVFVLFSAGKTNVTPNIETSRDGFFSFFPFSF